MSRLWAMTVDFDTIEVGDTLPVLIKWETEESIQRYSALHGDIELDSSAAEALPTRTVDGYINELLSKGFPPERLEADGSSVDTEHLKHVRANDTISLSGRVTDKRRVEGLRLVECAVSVENDRGETVARARSVVCL